MGWAKISDFGFSKMKSAQSAAQQQQSVLSVGHYIWTAPEILREKYHRKQGNSPILTG